MDLSKSWSNYGISLSEVTDNPFCWLKLNQTTKAHTALGLHLQTNKTNFALRRPTTL